MLFFFTLDWGQKKHLLVILGSGKQTFFIIL